MERSDCSQTHLSVIVRARSGDAGDLVRIYGPLAFQTARRLGLAAADAEDVMQVTLIEILTRLPGFEYDRNKGTFRGLVRTIVRGRCLDLYRRRSREPRADLPDGDWDALGVQAKEAELEAEFEREWRLSLLEVAMERVRKEVKPSTFLAFVRRYVDGGPIDEVAEELGQSTNQVSQNCRRVIQRLHGHVEVLARE